MKTRRLVIALLCLLASASTCYAEQGRIVDATTGIGVAEATVTLGDRIVETDADGRFQGEAGTVPCRRVRPGIGLPRCRRQRSGRETQRSG